MQQSQEYAQTSGKKNGNDLLDVSLYVQDLKTPIFKFVNKG